MSYQIAEKQYMSQSKKKIKPKKDLTKMLMFKDFKKNRNRLKNSQFCDKYFKDEEYTVDNIIFKKEDEFDSEWIIISGKNHEEENYFHKMFNKFLNISLSELICTFRK